MQRVTNKNKINYFNSYFSLLINYHKNGFWHRLFLTFDVDVKTRNSRTSVTITFDVPFLRRTWEC